MKKSRPTLPRWIGQMIWLVIIWAGGVAGLGIVAFAIRTVMKMVGMA